MQAKDDLKHILVDCPIFTGSRSHYLYKYFLASEVVDEGNFAEIKINISNE